MKLGENCKRYCQDIMEGDFPHTLMAKCKLESFIKCENFKCTCVYALKPLLPFLSIFSPEELSGWMCPNTAVLFRLMKKLN